LPADSERFGAAATPPDKQAPARARTHTSAESLAMGRVEVGRTHETLATG
jgi:hypothetical protein